MEPHPAFLKIRIAAFSVIMLISLVWSTLICVELFLRRNDSDQSLRDFLLVFLIVNSVTAIVLPALLLVQFRASIDGSRLFILLVFQIGSAALYTAFYIKTSCPDNDSVNICRQINTCVLACSWVNPVLLLSYAGCLFVTVQFGVRKPASLIVPEKRQSELPMMSPPPPSTRFSSSLIPGPPPAILSYGRSVPPVPPLPSSRRTSAGGSRRESIGDASRRSSKRLSKRLQKVFV
ncbi:uncharacterized protein LAESUDRAFT_809233 [Laetiporus sulphureus 93-53]|uniref:Uncharacterized protein n=1 Tax=Laetiporus sulphureus 93-53 TaxID=1314785 RepID=A0A165H5B5_9APHY|nr:uncharacterized protein LAESUDRAFT_809233 [Laetiporus sulphureus 93-53]KZT11263.1 hypothetical protein LAESUDRAFT_809233 [Laetiporus sulphureus 93-53]